MPCVPLKLRMPFALTIVSHTKEVVAVTGSQCIDAFKSDDDCDPTNNK